MTKYLNEIVHGNNLDSLKEMATDSVDLIASDPPYGLTGLCPKKLIEDETIKSRGFMGRKWDNVPDTETLGECLRVMKPGAFAYFIFTPRTDAKTVFCYRLIQAGFDVSFSPVYWTYASGFPKAAKIDLLIDKRAGVERDVIGVSNNGSGAQPSKLLNHEYGDTGIGYMDGSGKTFNVTAPTTPDAKRFEGAYAGFQPKPAVEVVIVAMKPLDEKSYVDQALSNGKGVTWFKDCLMPYQSDDDKDGAGQRSEMQNIKQKSFGAKGAIGERGVLPRTNFFDKGGRFPANLLVQDDVLNDGKTTKSGQNCVRRKPGKFIEHDLGGEGTIQVGHSDSGSYSRYFDLDAWYSRHIESLPKHVREIFPFLAVAKPAMSEKNAGLNRRDARKVNDGRKTEIDNPFQRGESERINTHVSVKPLKLMQYLILMGSREGDLILDPYAGTGTTCIAAQIENRNFVGLELDDESVEIARMRIAAIPPKQEKLEL